MSSKTNAQKTAPGDGALKDVAAAQHFKQPNYDKLCAPQGLAYVSNADRVRQKLDLVLRAAKQSRLENAKATFDVLLQETAGLGKCADFWVFVVRFWVISRDIGAAVDALQRGFQAGAQPSNLLFSTQQSLNELQKRLEKQKAMPARQLQSLPQIQMDFFQQSQTLIQKPPSAIEWTEQEQRRYQAERRPAATESTVFNVPSQLKNL